MVRGPISMAVAGAIMLVAVALVVGGPKAFRGLLPAAAGDFIEDMGGLASGRSGDRPADYLEDTPDGLRSAGRIAAWTGNQPIFIKDVIAGYTTRTASDAPAEIMTIRPIMGCLLTPPQEGTVIGHVTAGKSDLALPMTTYNDRHLAAAVRGFVKDYRERGSADAADFSGPSYEAYDVAVTETRAPVYLVLENAQGNRIWNIHAAPGVQIERVVLLGGDQAGVANLDPVVPVEVVLADGLGACGILPAYPLNKGHLIYQSMENGALDRSDGEATLAEIARQVEAYDIWFRDSFGVKAGESRVGFDEGTISLIGPIPGANEPKAVYAPIEGAKIRTTQDKFFEIRGQVAEGEDFASRVRAIATTFAFGDLKYLRQGVKF